MKFLDTLFHFFYLMGLQLTDPDLILGVFEVTKENSLSPQFCGWVGICVSTRYVRVCESMRGHVPVPVCQKQM